MKPVLKFAAIMMFMLVAVMFLLSLPPAAQAQGGYPLGADVVTFMTNRSYTINGTNWTTICSDNVQRVSLEIYQDGTNACRIWWNDAMTNNNAWSTNSLTKMWYLATTAPSNTWKSIRPMLWKGSLRMICDSIDIYHTDGIHVIETSGSY